MQGTRLLYSKTLSGASCQFANSDNNNPCKSQKKHNPGHQVQLT